MTPPIPTKFCGIRRISDLTPACGTSLATWENPRERESRRRRSAPGSVFWTPSVQLPFVWTASSSFWPGFCRISQFYKDSNGITWTMSSTSKKPKRHCMFIHSKAWTGWLNNEKLPSFWGGGGAGRWGNYATLTYCEECIFILRSSGWLHVLSTG